MKTINFMYFIHNYPYNFIESVWNGSLSAHLRKKFDSCCSECGRSSFGFLSWFMQLDRENQTKLVEWVESNYKAF